MKNPHSHKNPKKYNNNQQTQTANLVLESRSLQNMKVTIIHRPVKVKKALHSNQNISSDKASCVKKALVSLVNLFHFFFFHFIYHQKTPLNKNNLLYYKYLIFSTIFCSLTRSFGGDEKFLSKNY